MKNKKNSIESFKNRLKQTEERINELEDKSFEIIQSEYQKENRMKKSGLMWYHKKKGSIHFQTFQKRKKKGKKVLFKAITAENFQTMGRKRTSRFMRHEGAQIVWEWREVHWDTIKLSKLKEKWFQRKQ